MKTFLAFSLILFSLGSSVAQGGKTAAAQADKPLHPGPRTAACLVYDEQRKQVVLLGGYLWSSPRRQLEATELWAWNGQAWERIPDSTLRARTLSAALYDAQRRRIISFWGVGTAKEQRWEWDGKNWARAEDTRADDRIHAALVYDAARRKTLLFGGTIPQKPQTGTPPRWSYPTDTWEETANQWTQRTTQGPSGRAITCGAMVYDRQRRQVVLFGGLGEASAAGQPQPVYNDAWIWNGARWRQASGTTPPPRFAHSMAFDRRAGVVLLYGGSNGTTQFGDMWQWDGRQWTEIRLTGATPGKRSNHAMAYDAARGKTVLYGGGDGPKTFDDTWEWDGQQWTQVK
jgi:hypothetical protein